MGTQVSSKVFTMGYKTRYTKVKPVDVHIKLLYREILTFSPIYATFKM